MERAEGNGVSVIEADALQRAQAIPREVWQKARETQVCPLCRSGPFKMLAGHMAKTHGIYQDQLRDLMHVLKDDPICSPDLSLQRAARNRLDFSQGKEPIHQIHGAGWPRIYSQSGLDVMRAKAKIARLAHIKMSLSLSDRNEIVRRRTAGETYREIASDLGVSASRVHQIYHEHRAKAAA